MPEAEQEWDAELVNTRPVSHIYQQGQEREGIREEGSHI